MVLADFSILHQKSIAVRLKIGDSPILLTGIGSVQEDKVLGTVLRIPIRDPAGDFEILLKQSESQVDILTGAEFGCDYLLPLGNSCPALVGSSS